MWIQMTMMLIADFVWNDATFLLVHHENVCNQAIRNTVFSPSSCFIEYIFKPSHLSKPHHNRVCVYEKNVTERLSCCYAKYRLNYVFATHLINLGGKMQYFCDNWIGARFTENKMCLLFIYTFWQFRLTFRFCSLNVRSMQSGNISSFCDVSRIGIFEIEFSFYFQKSLVLLCHECNLSIFNWVAHSKNSINYLYHL